MQPQDESGFRNSTRFRDRTKSILVDSFKIGGSFFGQQGTNKTIYTLSLPEISLVPKQDFMKQQSCQTCFLVFGKITRQHHCRVCGNAVCSSCSCSSINNQRACDVCAYKYSNHQRELKKFEVITGLKRISKGLLGVKREAEHQLKDIQSGLPSQKTIQQQDDTTNKKVGELERKLIETREQRQVIEARMAELKSN